MPINLGLLYTKQVLYSNNYVYFFTNLQITEVFVMLVYIKYFEGAGACLTPLLHVAPVPTHRINDTRDINDGYLQIYNWNFLDMSNK